MNNVPPPGACHARGFPDRGCTDTSILALKIFDQCKQKSCDSYGPWLSAERCECVILESPEEQSFGRFVMPGRPITLPDTVAKVKIGSFIVKKIVPLVTRPSQLRQGCWEVEVQIAYECSLQLLNAEMRPLPIKCLCPEGEVKDSMQAAYCCTQIHTLYGGNADAPIVATDLFFEREFNRPHALVEWKAYPLDASIQCVHDCACCDNVFDCIYEETLQYIYLSIGSYMMLFLYRIVSLLVESKGYDIPKDCPESDVCEGFLKTNFGEEEIRS